MLSEKGLDYLAKMDSYLYRGMLASLRNKSFDEDEVRTATKEFMQLLVTAYTNELEEGYTILVVSPDFVASTANYDAETRSSFRVKTISVAFGEPVRETA